MASEKITEEDVYLCTGNPLPMDIEQISHWLLNEPFAESYKSMWNIIGIFIFLAFDSMVLTHDSLLLLALCRNIRNEDEKRTCHC